MAPPAGTLRVGRYFLTLLALLAVLYAIVFWPGQPHTPKLGLDLEGGAQVTLKARTPDNKAPSKNSLNQARQIISNRVNGLGVSEAEVITQGSDRIVVSVPGKGVEDLAGISRAAQLNFRPAIIQPIPITNTPAASTTSAGASGSAGGSPSSSGSPAATGSASAAPSASSSTSPSPQGRVVPHAAGTTPPAGTTPGKTTPGKTTPAAPASPSPSATDTAAPTVPQDAETTNLINQWAKLSADGKVFAPPADATALQALSASQQTALSNLIQAWNCNNHATDQPTKPLISCDEAHTQKYLLGPVIVAGTELKSASALAPGSQQGQLQWIVQLSLKATGQRQWAKYTSEHNEQTKAGDVANLVAYTLDNDVLEAATVQSTINGDTQISGNFTAKSAQNLANSLKYGALPLSFDSLTNGNISPTLGSSQLKAGLLAGGIGLVLVIIYSMFYYRALGLVTIASLVVSAGLTYAMLVILGHQIGFTLTLAGIAGFIVAVGITADSFVVFFERIKDEVHEGRSARTAVPRAWERARRTIISADTVSLLAAVVLYYFAAGDVKGFAFTLGLSTLLDLVIVFLFTHPLVSLFSRSAAFGSARFTGLNAVRSGGVPTRDVAPEPELVPVGAPPGADVESQPATSPDRTRPAARPKPERGTSRRTASQTPSRTAPSKTAPSKTAPTAPAEAGGSEPAPATETPSRARVAGQSAAERAAARRGLQRPTGDATEEDQS